MSDLNNPKSKSVTIPPTFSGMRLNEALARLGVIVDSPCGGSGVCGKCRVKFAGGSLAELSGGTITAGDTPITLSACRYVCTDAGAVIESLPQSGDMFVRKKSGSCPDVAGIAVDIGTTTLAVAAVDRNGGIISEVTADNPQKIFGADVISRISAAEDGKTDIMHRLVCDAVDRAIAELCRDPGVSAPIKGVAAGNPAMTALFCGVSPASLARAPFAPPFTESRTVRMEKSGAVIRTVPIASAFIGGDLVCGALKYRLQVADRPTLFVDLGTNGEMAVADGRGGLFVASAAAGPALEGAGISCGVGGIPGAICSVVGLEGGRPIFRTVGGKPPTGICGGGLADLISILLDSGIITPDGELIGGRYIIDREHDIYITADDVHAYMLAKGAICAAVVCLVNGAGLRLADIKRAVIAGGLGSHVNRFSAARTGLLPERIARVADFVGNSSLEGAAVCVSDHDFFREAEIFSKKSVTLTLAGSSLFESEFMRCMNFPGFDQDMGE